METNEFVQKLLITGCQFYKGFENNIELFLKNLDPSLLQNVILGILALLVPVGVGILSYFFEERSKGNIEANLELYILLKTVLKADKIVIYSFLNLLLLALFDVSFYFKVASILFIVIYFVWIFFVPFKNIWGWFLSNTSKFSVLFLSKLSVIKDTETIVHSWKALWLASGKTNEREFTTIFISHIDDAIRCGKFDLAIQLAQNYASNLEKREKFSVGYEIPPKIFEWHESLWNQEQIWLSDSNTEKKIQNIFSQKHFPTFRDWALKLFKWKNLKRDLFWNWHYFGGDFFQEVVKILLKDGHGPYQLFSVFKKHIDYCEQKLDKIEDEKNKERYWNYITGLFASFCPTFFNEIDKAPSSHSIWRHNFPQEWKIVPNNSDKKIPRVVLHEFIQWARDRVFEDDDSKDFDKDLTEVIRGIFPNVHSSLFTTFLMLFFSGEVKYVFERKPNFNISGASVSWSGSIEETEEDRDRRLSEMMRDKDASQKDDTIQIILKFFHFWLVPTIYKDNLTEDESKNRTNLSEDQRLVIVKRVRKEKLEKIKIELESDEVNEICKDSETKQARKNSLLELIKLLDSSI